MLSHFKNSIDLKTCYTVGLPRALCVSAQPWLSSPLMYVLVPSFCATPEYNPEEVSFLILLWLHCRNTLWFTFIFYFQQSHFHPRSSFSKYAYQEWLEFTGIKILRLAKETYSSKTLLLVFVYQELVTDVLYMFIPEAGAFLPPP